ncbi:MAG: hypothetical protein HOE76_03220 [Euryarchaeota archaeon]|jgi:thiol-disulfide isomerase/thioredoxin|nr:hypothetical protein [Euryarchaeota archaeon]MBT4982351.1 hypothetical protein [Euryarchaeota archaeon]MBT5184889.1 hypothetical protein [Euryarchaeota archaeon]
MRSRVILIALVLGLASIPSAQGGTAEKLEDVGFTFGGLTLDANTTGNATSSLADLPAVVEYYTATWCANCVYVEHALDDVENNSVNIQQFHFHRDQDSEDPWGTAEGEARWDDRYDGGVAPTVVFNGSMKQIGSVAEGDSLEEDYTALAAMDLELGAGVSSMGWNNDSGVFTWNLQFDESIIPEDGELVHMLWITERFANFPDGSNGVENYPHVVKALFSLGNNSSGAMVIDLPAAHDGDDLQLHLIHQIVLPDSVEENNSQPPIPVKSDNQNDGGLPSLSLIAVLSVVMVAAFTVQRKQQ